MLEIYTALSIVLAVAITLSGASPWLLLPEFIACFAGFLLLHLVAAFVISLFIDKDKEVNDAKPIWWFILMESVRVADFASGVRVHVQGMDKLDKRGQYLFVGNHRSNYDPLVSMVAFRAFHAAFISKPENFNIPIAGPLMHKCAFLPIDRDNPRNAIKTIMRAADLLDGGRMSVAVYPEGTRNKTGRGLLEFHNGVFKIAQRAKVPIAVWTIKGSEEIAHRAPFRFSRVTIDVAAVIPAEEVQRLKTSALGEQIRDIMLRSLGDKAEA